MKSAIELARCARCNRHVLRSERVCPHCRAVVPLAQRAPVGTASVVAVLVGVGAAGALGCSSIASGSDSEGGGGSSTADGGGSPTSKSSSKAKTAAATASGTATNSTMSASYGMPGTWSAGSGCDSFAECEGNGTDPYSGCWECAVLGDSGTASDGGACAAAFAACFGDGSLECAGATDPECCPFIDCVADCDADMNGSIELGAELDCFCTNNGSGCDATQMPGTCLGDYPSGVVTAYEWETCLYEDVCSMSCGH